MKNVKHLILGILAILLILRNEKSYAQVSTIPNNGTAGDYVGWDISMLGTPLEILTTAPDNINFSTGNTFRMTIGGTSGFVGIGSTLTTPSFQLDVADDINLNPGTFPNFGYRWNGDIILKTNSGDNVFVGFNAGDNITSGSANTFMGTNAGNNKVLL